MEILIERTNGLNAKMAWTANMMTTMINYGCDKDDDHDDGTMVNYDDITG